MADKVSLATLALAKAYTDEHGGGGGGTSNYNDLTHLPTVNGVEFKGTMTGETLGLVNAEDGKGLSANDYTDADKSIVGGVTSALAGKVDKVSGKGLSTNDYSDTDKAVVDGVTTALNDKVDKVSGKGLSTNDYSDADKTIVGGVTTALAGKVDKNGTDRLMTSAEGTKLNGLAEIKSVGSGLNLNSTTGELSSDIPNGSTVTPTGVVATWLRCANLRQTYTTLEQVLADTSVLDALTKSTNAVDYMVRSTTWASTVCADSSAMARIGANDYCADILLGDSTWLSAICNSTYFESVLNVKVPTMTSNNSYGFQAIQTDTYADFYAYKAFDGNTQTVNNIQSVASSGIWLGIVFPVAVSIYKVGAIQNTLGSTPAYTCNIKVQYSDNGTSWSDAQPSFNTVGGDYVYQTLNNDYGEHRYWRIYLNSTSHSGTTAFGFSFLQFYGRSEATSDVSIDTTGTASASSTRQQQLTIDGVATDIDGTKYMETTSYTTPSTGVRRFTFTNNVIRDSDDVDYRFSANVYGVSPTNVTIDTTGSTNVMMVDFNASDNVGKCRIYIRG